MRLYTGDGAYADINDALFSGRMPKKKKYADAVPHIDAAIKRYEVDRDIIVYKGTDWKYFASMEEGSEGEWGAYYSAAVTKGPTRPFIERIRRGGGNPLRLEIRVPKGASGIYVGNNTDFKRPQDEFVLARGTGFRVLERTEGRIVVEVTGRAG